MKLLKYYKDLLNEDNRTKLIGLLSILILLWIILYALPSLFFSLFYTFLGNTILLLSVILIGATYSAVHGVAAAVLVILLYQLSHPFSFTKTNTNTKESFWTQDSTNTFLKIQDTINRNTNFDTTMIQKQASQEEVDYFNSHGMWPWSESTKLLYIEAVNRNPYIRSFPPDSMIHARTVYNENAMLQILKTQSKEGQFLLRGVEINTGVPDTTGRGTFGYTSGLMTNATNPTSKVVVCDPKTNQLKQRQFLGYGGILTEQVKKETHVDYNDLENQIPGFKFLDEPCNPCTNMNQNHHNNMNNTCPFTLDISGNETGVSSIWKYLWSQ